MRYPQRWRSSDRVCWCWYPWRVFTQHSSRNLLMTIFLSHTRCINSKLITNSYQFDKSTISVRSNRWIRLVRKYCYFNNVESGKSDHVTTIREEFSSCSLRVAGSQIEKSITFFYTRLTTNMLLYMTKNAISGSNGWSSFRENTILIGRPIMMPTFHTSQFLFIQGFQCNEWF